MTTVYREAYALACEQGFVQSAEGVWPDVDRGFGLTTGLLLHPDHADAGELCAEIGDAYYTELLALLRGGR